MICGTEVLAFLKSGSTVVHCATVGLDVLVQMADARDNRLAEDTIGCAMRISELRASDY
jgi:hypothetical protein